MSNKSTVQLPQVDDLDPSDVMHLSRDVGGTRTDLHINRQDAVPQYFTQTTIIPAAQVLTLFTTPREVVTAPPASQYILAKDLIVTFTGGTLSYATNTDLRLGPTGSVSSTTYTHKSDISNPFNPVYSPPVSSGTAASSIVAGTGLSVKIMTGNPTTGDYDVNVTVIYQKIDA